MKKHNVPTTSGKTPTGPVDSSPQDPGVDIESELCKGCEFCVDVCPEDCLYMSDMINSRGYRYARYEGEECTGCGVCYYNCPEPGAIVVHKGSGRKKEKSRG